MMDLAVFDLDETLICEDSTSLWLRWLVSQGFAPEEIIRQEQALMAQYHAGSLSIEEYMRTTLSPLTGMATLTVAGWVRRFIHRDILPRVFPAARERIQWHQQRGDTVMIITASGDHLAVPIAERLGVHGALAIGVGDKVNMLQYSTYSVISPEGCASILWKSADKAPLAAEAMGITAGRLKELKLIDSIIPEPLGGAHRHPVDMAAALKQQLLADLADLDVLSTEELLNRRYQRLMSYGYA